jgi:hypothetical protein
MIARNFVFWDRGVKVANPRVSEKSGVLLSREERKEETPIPRGLRKTEQPGSLCLRVL